MKKVLLILLASSSIFLQAQKIDSESGLIIAKGFETVKANCTVCHSAKFITITSPINNLNYSIILYGKNRCKKIITQRVV